MKEVIKVFNVSYKVKTKSIVDSVSFSVNNNDIFALLGENGSGKSTLIDLMLGDLKTDSGYVNFLVKKIVILIMLVLCMITYPYFLC